VGGTHAQHPGNDNGRLRSFHVIVEYISPMMLPNDGFISPPALYIVIGQLMLPSASTSGWAGEVWQSSIRIAFPVWLNSSE
jgi:hypothetical protein